MCTLQQCADLRLITVSTYTTEGAKTMDLIRAVGRRIKGRAVSLAEELLLPRSRKRGPRGAIFQEIYKTNYWRGESRSGEGSDLIQTQQIRVDLPRLLKRVRATSMLDLPCGDFFWMQHVDTDIEYIGGDIVAEIVDLNNQKYGARNRRFLRLDVCEDRLPKVDLIFSRDLLVHLSFEDIRRALLNMKESGATWLLTTTFVSREVNIDISTGDWRTLNLQKAPFFFSEPIEIINEGCTQFDGDYADKSLALWRLDAISF